MKTFEAKWNRAGLTVRATIRPATSTSNWGLTIEEARAFVSVLNAAIADGEKHLLEIAEERKCRVTT